MGLNRCEVRTNLLKYFIKEVLLRSSVILLFCCLISSGIIADEKSPVTMPLPALADSAAWEIKPQDSTVLSLTEQKDWLSVGFKCEKGNKGRLLLKQPVQIPDWVTGLSFLGTNNGTLSGLWIMVLISDAKGREYLYHTSSYHSFKYGVFYPEHIQRRCREVRFSVEGLERPKLVPKAGASITGVNNTWADPEKPLTLKGLYFEGDQHRENDKNTPQFLFRDFVLTGLNPQNSKFYYQFDDQECFGEITPFPYVTPGQFGRWFGRQFNFSWEVLDDYAGQPFLAGGKSFNLDPDDNTKPMPVQLAEHLEIPVDTEGTYWVRVKFRWAKKLDSIPEVIDEKEYRLYVHKGKKRIEHQPISADQFIPNNYIRIAPTRPSLIFADNEKFFVPVVFWKPENDSREWKCQVTVTRGKQGEAVKELEASPKWENDRFTVNCDLSSLPAGAYQVTGKLLTEGRLFDLTARLVGRKDAGHVKDKTAAVLAGVPSWQQLLNAKESMFHLCPILPDNGVRDRQQEAWDNYFRPFLDHAGELSRDIELQIPWKNVEPLPGVYDWSTVDRFVDYADKKRLQVLLWPEFRAGNTPEWLPSFCEENPEGAIFGHNAYLFHGARPNLFHAPAIRDRIMMLISKMVERYRSHPGVQGYFACLEHPGDAPYKGWFEGYSPESRKAFIEYCKRKWPDLVQLNKRWQTNFASWQDVDHPRGNVSERFRLDWLLFRTDSIEDFLKEIVKTIRGFDPKRLIVIYGDGYHDLDWFRDQGCMSANGGSHDVMAYPAYAQVALQKLPQRTEDHSPGNWSAYFPSQMDASVFAMTAAGGINAHCKAYVRTQIPWAEYLKDRDQSLGRYQRFIPVWQELRHTECLPIETFLYSDITSYLISAKTTYFGWYNSPWQLINVEAAHIPVSAGPYEFWKNGKLLMLTNDKTDTLEQAAIDRIVGYAENGGTVLMTANAGRKCIEDSQADWVLLKRFGFTSPAGAEQQNRKATAAPQAGEIFNETAKPFVLRDIWQMSPSADTRTAAFFDPDRKQAAISWKPFGKGKVAVIWARTLVPPMHSKENYPFLRDIAKWAGVDLYSDATTDLFWTNLLKQKDKDVYYGLVHVGTWQDCPNQPVTGAVQWLGVPDGNYSVTEILSGKKLGDFSAGDLRTKGISLTLKPREVAIYKIEKR